MTGLTATWTTKLLAYGLATALSTGMLAGWAALGASVKQDVYTVMKTKPPRQKKVRPAPVRPAPQVVAVPGPLANT